MATSVLAQPESNRYPLVAGPIHTVVVLTVLGVWAFYGKVFADHLSTAANPNRVRLYVLTLFFEWLVFVLVVTGARLGGAPLRIILGDRWRSVRQVLRDIGIAAAFWVVSTGILFSVALLLRLSTYNRRMDVMLPHGATEITLWIALSATAGVCEETIFRGYLQNQFIALTKSVPAGLLLSAAAFGAAHAYQGFRMVILIALYGAMFGILAHWRGSVRPGMIAHAWQDSLSGVLAALTR